MLPPAVYDLAHRQLGVVSRRQLRRWMREAQIDHRIGPGRELRRLERGVYVLGGAGDRALHRGLAAALRAGPSATLTGPVVLADLGLEPFLDNRRFEVLTAPGRRVRGAGFPHRPDPDPRRAVRLRGEVRLATPVDALVDAAGFQPHVSERMLRLAYDLCRWRNLLTPRQLALRIAALDGRSPGAAALRELLELDGPAPESEGERRLVRLLGGFDPPPEPQVWVTPNRRVDVYFRDLRFAFEYLGVVDHTGVAARLADDARNRELREQHLAIGYVTHADLAQPDAFVTSVVARLAIRAHELGLSSPLAPPASAVVASG